MNKETIEKELKGNWAGRNLWYYDEIGSTNDMVMELGEEGAPHGTTVVADQQNGGKGRRGRTWLSPSGTNIYVSILLRPEFDVQKAPMLTLLMAYSVTKVLRESEGLDARIKWPNDIVLNRKKICGILTEMTMKESSIDYVVIGVGINVNNEEIPEELTQSATSLKLETGKVIDRSILLSRILERFEKDYEAFARAGDLSPVQESYNQILVNRENQVRVLEPGNEYQAVAHGINHLGELMVEKEDGTRETVFAGEVSVRGIYGYVQEEKEMYQDKIVLCGANSYEEKYYLNPDFANLPEYIQDELKILCVLYVNDVGGILTLVFDEDGNLKLEVTSEEGDPMFDDIGSQLKIKQIQNDPEKQELLRQLELFYKIFFLEIPEEELFPEKEF